MWDESEDGPSIPEPVATTAPPNLPHHPPASMGEDSFILNPTQSSSDLISGSSAPPLGSARSISTADQDRDSIISATRLLEQQREYDPAPGPGKPIGLLAAMGTKFAKKPIYRSRKCKILCPILGGIVAIISILIILFPVLRAIAKHTLSTSVMHIVGSNITRASDSSFTLTLEGQVTKVGIFPAHLIFAEPITVHWIAPENLTQELILGEFPLAPIGVAAGHGRIKQQTKFTILNEPAFARFTEYLITQSEFTWRLKSKNVQAKAFSFIPVNGLNFVKDLTLPGMANMTDVSISNFQLPGDDPAGGISLAVSTQFTNPSAFGIEIGTLAVDLYYEDLYLGPAQTTVPVNLTSGVNNINLVGRMLPYSNDTVKLAQLSHVFSNYLNGVVTPVKAIGRSVTLVSGESIDWLSAGIKALILNVPLVTERISPITSITIKELSLGFDSDQPYAPTANSSQIGATFGLPFGFSLAISELQTAFTIVDNKTAVTSLAGPFGLAETAILTRDAGYTTGELKLDLPIARLVTPPSYTDHLIFDQFNYDFTTTKGANFFLVGNTSVITDTPLGQVLLSNIGFTVPAGLIGLDGLSAAPTEIISVDVIGGTVDAAVLAIKVGITNPSNLDLTVGDVTFQLFNGDYFLGTTIIPSLHLVPGYQTYDSTGYFQANNNPGALSTFTNYAQGIDANLTISGFNGSTKCESLTQAFMAIHLKSTLAGLSTKLLNYASLTILPTTGVTNDFANSVVSLSNPFTASLDISNIQSNITSHGFSVGTINEATSFLASGKGASLSPILDFNLNLYPPDIFALLRSLAVEIGLNVEALDGVVAIGGYKYSTPSTKSKRSLISQEDQEYADQLVSPSRLIAPGKDQSEHMFTPNAVATDYEGSQDVYDFAPEIVNGTLVKRNLISKRNIYTGFDLPTFVMKAFAPLTVDIDLVSALGIGEFETVLHYTQQGIPARTDSSLTLLLPILARPIVQKIVDEANLGIETVMITDPTNIAFTTTLIGSITNTGPFDAIISFPTGLTIAWNGKPLGSIAMANTTLVADVGASLDVVAPFTITDLAHLTDFTSYLLTEPSFVWQIYGTNLSVTALGITVDGISISKNVVLDGMNGFKGLVTIEKFDLPANDPAGGVQLVLATTLTNPASVGVALSTIGFANSFGSTVIGPASSTAAFSLTPKSTIALPLTGRLVPQTSAQGLADVSTIFNGFIHGVPSELIVTGTNAGPADCTWLNEGIKMLAIAVTLPAAQNLEVINSIKLNQVTLMFSEATAEAPLFSTSNTVADFQLPFAFPINIIEAQTSIIASNPNSAGSRFAKRASSDFASLKVPMLPSITDVVARTLLLTFENVPFTSSDDSVFSSYLRDVTNSASKSFGLHGSATTVTSTAIGNLLLSDIGFSVDTNLLGLQGLNAKPAVVSNLDVYHGYSNYLQINVDTALYNPSNITIGTGDVSFNLQFESETIGAAVISGLVLVPGDNLVPTAVHFQPSGGASAAAGQLLLKNFVQGVSSNTVIVGTKGTTPIKSLQAALGSIQLKAVIPPIHQNLITQAALVFPLNIGDSDGDTDIAAATFNLANPFTASINLINVLANASFEGITLGEINVKGLQPPVNAPGHTLVTSPSLPITINLDPKALVKFLTAAAASQGVSLGPLAAPFDYLLSLSSTKSSIQSSVNPAPETCTPSGSTALVQGIILAAVKNLETNLTIQSLTKLDDYQTPLDFSQYQVPTILDRSVLYLTGVLGKPIVQQIVAETTLSFSSGMITNITDAGFTVALKGALLNAGPFDALISFPHDLEVTWQGSNIATIALSPICSTANVAVPNLETIGILTITDYNRFVDFTTFILLNPSFEWTISSSKVRVLALGAIFDDVPLSKNVSFKAFNGLPGTTIINPDFPGDAPAGGIMLVTDSLITSPSNLGIRLGHVSFTAYFKNEEVGLIENPDLTLIALGTVSAHLTGTIIERTSAASTASLGLLFSSFLKGINQTLAVTGNSVVSPAQPNSPVNWLSAAFKHLTLDVVLPGHVYSIISAITLEDLAVSIEQESEAYSVPSTNQRTNAIYKNPFGFSLTAQQVGGSFDISKNGIDAGVLTLPLADVVSSETSTGQNANLVLDFKKPAILQSLNTGAFNDFFNSITNTANVEFFLHGFADVTARTNAGVIPITGIPFNVSTSLLGLESLNSRPTIVSNLDVYHGFTDYLQLNADATLYNPSNITLTTNYVEFGLLFDSQIIGSINIGDLHLTPGPNLLKTQVHYSLLSGAPIVAGKLLLANFVEGITSNVAIVGIPDSSPYGSLKEALGTISIHTSIPPLHQPLITRAVLSFPIDVATTFSASAVFDLDNPFTASINLIDIIANATYQDSFLGQINSQDLNPTVSARGHSKITSRSLPFSLTSNVKFLIRFIQAAARAQGVDLGILLPGFDYVLGLSSTASNIIATVNPNKETCNPTGTTTTVENLVLAAVNNLETNLTIQSVVKLDDYQTPLDFSQYQVPTILDRSVLYLVGLIGKNIVSHIVDEATLSFSGGFVNNVTDSGFTVALKGALLNAGQFDALISFPHDLEVTWQGSNIATIALPPICSPANVGVPNLETTGILTITDYNRFVDFASYLLLNPSFQWTISSSKVRVLALGTIFDDVTLSKNVTFEAFNKFPGLTLSNPDFPGDESNGIKLNLDSLLFSPSNLGIELGDLTFISAFEGEEVGPVVSKNVVLQAKSTTPLPFVGTILYTNRQTNLNALGDLFSNFLAGLNSTLQVTGNSVTSPAQPHSPVLWLSAALKTLTLNAVLPGHVYDIISAVDILDFSVYAQDPSQSYVVNFANNRTDVTFKNPFKFSLKPIAVGGDFIINYRGVDASVIQVPKAAVVSSEASTGNDASLVIQIQPVTALVALNNAAEQDFFDAVTNSARVDYRVTGSSNITALTAAGNIPISGIKLNVVASFAPALNGFGGKVFIPALPLVIGSGAGDIFSPSSGSEFMRVAITFTLESSAALFLATNRVSLALFYQGIKLGVVAVPTFDLSPKSQSTFKGEFLYMPSTADSRQASALLTSYISSKDPINFTLHGDSSSTPYGSLSKAIGNLSFTSSFPGQGIPLIVDLIVYVDLVTAMCSNTGQISFRINNQLGTSLTVKTLAGTGSQNNVQYASFDSTLTSPLYTESKQNPGPYSVQIPVKLTQGGLGSLSLLSPASQSQGLDIDIVSALLVDQYPVNYLHYQQKNVPYTVVYTSGGNPIAAGPVGEILGILGELPSILQCSTGGSATCNGTPALCSALGLLGPIAPITSILSPVIAPITSVLAPITSVLSPVLAPVESILSPVLPTLAPTPSATSKPSSSSSSTSSSSSSSTSESSSATPPLVAAPSLPTLPIKRTLAIEDFLAFETEEHEGEYLD